MVKYHFTDESTAIGSISATDPRFSLFLSLEYECLLISPIVILIGKHLNRNHIRWRNCEINEYSKRILISSFVHAFSLSFSKLHLIIWTITRGAAASTSSRTPPSLHIRNLLRWRMASFVPATCRWTWQFLKQWSLSRLSDMRNLKY